MPAPRTRRYTHGCLIALAVVGAMGIMLVLGIGLLLVLASMAVVSHGAALDEEFRFQEITVGGTRGEPKVVCIPIEGVISGGVLPGIAATPAAVFAAQLAKAAGDSSVSAVILYVDSPGGGITASDVMYQQIMAFRQANRKPVVACLMDVAASGGYYVSVACDRIIAHPTTVTGSIGVMMPLYDVTGLMSKIGIQDETMATGPFKDIGSPFKAKDEQQKAREREILQGILTEMYERFVSVVAEGRRMEPQRVRELADGRIFTGPQALALGLVDEIGYESDAVAAAKKLAGVEKVHLVRYRRVIPLSEILSVYSRGPSLTLDVGQGVGLHEMRPLFLWVPPVPRQGAASAP
jgi:protease-4